MRPYLTYGIVIAIALFAVFAAVFVQPWFTPPPWVMVATTGLIILTDVLLGMIWWERDGEHTDRLVIMPDRAALVAGGGVILVAILLKSSLLEADPWLFTAFAAAFIAHLAARSHQKARQDQKRKNRNST